MKTIYKIIFLCFLVVLSSFYVSAQISKKALPRTMRSSYQNSNNTNKKIALPVFTMEKQTPESIAKVINQQSKDCPNCRSDAYGIGQKANIDVLKEAAVEQTADGKIYRYVIEAPNAKGLQIYFKEFLLPNGGEVYVYNENKSMVLGAFTNANNKEGGYFLLQVIRGSSVTVEYFEPTGTNDNVTRLKIEDVIYCYTDVFDIDRSVDGAFGNDENGGCDVSCIPDFICDEDGEYWKETASTVGMILIYNPSGALAHSGTGTLMNNTNQDKKPYFLTSYHISSTYPFWDNGYDNIVVQFNYQREYCGQDPDDIDMTQSVSGASYMVGDEPTDMVLIELYEEPPMEYKISYAGWENFDNFALTESPYKGIHHPCRSLKRISKTPEIQQSDYGRTAGQGSSHWYVTWESGVTQNRSSGSPLFNSQKQVIGFLHGGSSNCGIGANNPDWYNKLSTSWSMLAPYLSPNSVAHSCTTITPIYPGHCFNKIQDSGEGGIDCGSGCEPCPTSCHDHTMNGLETGIDCGGPCNPCPTCNDYRKNGNETDVDCGGPDCAPCVTIAELCSNKKIDTKTNETGIDCGGQCGPCSNFCSDGKWNGDEVLADCGGSCSPCVSLMPDILGSTFEVPNVTACNTFSNTKTEFTNAFSVENSSCSATGWKAAYGDPSILQDAPGTNKFMNLNTYSVAIIRCTPNQNVIRSSGVFYQLPANLSPDKEYTLTFKYKSAWRPGVYGTIINNIEVAVTHGLVQRHTPNSGVANLYPDNPATCPDYLQRLNEYHYPAYTFEKQTLTDMGGDELHADWRVQQIPFTVENTGFNQIFIATYMANYSKLSPSQTFDEHVGAIQFDDFVLQEKVRTDPRPYKYTSVIAPGGGGFTEMHLTNNAILGSMCQSVPYYFSIGYLHSVNSNQNIVLGNSTIVKNTKEQPILTGNNDYNYFADPLVLNAQTMIDFTTGLDIAAGATVLAEIVPCSTFPGAIYRTVDEPVDPAELSDKGFTIYPNPSSGVFTILHQSTTESHYKISVYNSIGQLVVEQESQTVESTLDMTRFNEGVYIVKIIEDGSDIAKIEKVMLWH